MEKKKTLLKQMIKLTFISLLLIACNNKSKDAGDYYHKCVIQNIEQLERSTIEIDNKYIISTDCGKYITKINKGLKVGDTIIIRK